MVPVANKKIVPYEGSDQGRCGICLDQASLQRRLFRYEECHGHDGFHPDCFLDWLIRGSSCSACTRTIPSACWIRFGEEQEPQLFVQNEKGKEATTRLQDTITSYEQLNKNLKNKIENARRVIQQARTSSLPRYPQEGKIVVSTLFDLHEALYQHYEQITEEGLSEEVEILLDGIRSQHPLAKDVISKNFVGHWPQSAAIWACDEFRLIYKDVCQIEQHLILLEIYKAQVVEIRNLQREEERVNQRRRWFDLIECVAAAAQRILDRK